MNRLTPARAEPNRARGNTRLVVPPGSISAAPQRITSLRMPKRRSSCYSPITRRGWRLVTPRRLNTRICPATPSLQCAIRSSPDLPGIAGAAVDVTGRCSPDGQTYGRSTVPNIASPRVSEVCTTDHRPAGGDDPGSPAGAPAAETAFRSWYTRSLSRTAGPTRPACRRREDTSFVDVHQCAPSAGSAGRSTRIGPEACPARTVFICPTAARTARGG